MAGNIAGMTEITGKTVRVNGLNIFYLESGKGNPVERLAILNTFLHPRLPFLMGLLFLASKIPGIGKLFATPSGVAATIKLGVSNKNVLTEELIETYQAPFESTDAQKALLKAFNAGRPA